MHNVQMPRKTLNFLLSGHGGLPLGALYGKRRLMVGQLAP